MNWALVFSLWAWCASGSPELVIALISVAFSQRWILKGRPRLGKGRGILSSLWWPPPSPRPGSRCPPVTPLTPLPPTTTTKSPPPLPCHSFYLVTLGNISVLLSRWRYLPLYGPDEGQRVRPGVDPSLAQRVLHACRWRVYIQYNEGFSPSYCRHIAEEEGWREDSVKDKRYAMKWLEWRKWSR